MSEQEIMQKVRNIEKLLENEADPLKRLQDRRVLKSLLQQLERMKSALREEWVI